MSIEFYPEIILEGDLSPDAFGAEVDDICQEIHAACKGFGTAEDRLLKVMGSMSPSTRCKVPIRYKELFGKELRAVMKSECGNRDFGFALQLLAVDPLAADCMLVEKACDGAGTNELLLFTIICGRTNREMELLKKKFFDLVTKDLGRVLDRELGGNLEALVINVMQASQQDYDEDFHNDEKVKEDIDALHEFGIGSWGTNEKGLFKILCASPPEYVKKLNQAYAEKHGYSLTKALEKELGGHVRDAATFMLGMKLNPIKQVSDLVNRACKGLGSNELLLTATLIRYSGILKEVMIAHAEEYSTDMKERIKGETGGKYEKLLLTLLDSAE
ncbi:hypothetical protein FisN_25Lh008 [Fistulifera solaris]|uniref:Annexin n=1 Tax=Fistulifera solaris TaxID=1519565 RepID=A0A1Z5JL97_FISSO|nr:hypothetical protein FisN_25Lh008 [Fistulifera solaris]|eukprot:GAX14795.1 hypothetical protein FisN_25Lh008 [Fistulifera solaris]